MGIFSSKKKHIVDTSVVRMIEDENIPSAHLVALVESIFDDSSVVDSIQNQALNGAFRDFERMHRYAAEPGNYYYGLPDAAVISSDDGQAAAITAIEADTGRTITLDYYHFRPLNNIHSGWQHLYENLAYDAVTNEIVTLSGTVGFDCYLDKMVAVHDTTAGQEIEQDAVGTWEPSASSGETPERPPWDDLDTTGELVTTHEYRVGDGETESVEIHYTYLDGDDVVQYASEVLDLSSYDTDQEYHQAKYTYEVAAVEYTAYWTYDALTGSHTALNNVFGASYTAPGTYFPIVVFRTDDYNITDPLRPGFDQQIVDDSIALCEKINLDYQEISDAMHADGDIGDVDQAVMMMAVPITSENPAEIRYLFEYFSDLHDRLPAAATTENYSEAPSLTSSDYGLSGGPNTSYAFDIQDADFRVTISFQKIKRQLKAGSVGAPGTYVNYEEVFDPYNIPFRDVQSGLSSIPVGVENRNQRIFQHQITDTVYEEITIDSPKIRYHIYKDKGAEAGADDDRMLIPLDYNVVGGLPFLVREELYYRSLHFVFNSHILQTTKWYQRGAFGALLTVIALVIAFHVGPWAGNFAAALASGVAGAAAMVLFNFIVTQILIGLVVQYVFNAIAEALGPELAFLLAVVLAIAGTIKVLKAGALVTGSTAAKFLQAANGLLSGATNAFATKIEGLAEDYAEYQLLADELQEELDRGQDLLGNPLDLNPFAFIGQEPLYVAGEDPDSYFSRTVHSGNVGVQSLNIVQNFVDISLTLPTIEDTVGDMNR